MTRLKLINYRFVRILLSFTLLSASNSASASALCPAPSPANVQRFSAASPHVLRNLSRRSQALFRFKSECSIDHRVEEVKAHQYQTSFCHTHALAELWNSNVPAEFNVDPYNLSLQIWIHQNGNQMDDILNTERERITNLLGSVSPRVLTHNSGLHFLKSLGQAGRLETDFDFMKTYGYFTKENAPIQLSGFEVSVLTDLYLLAFRNIIRAHHFGVTEKLVKEHLQSVYRKAMDKAWVEGSFELSKESMERQRNFAANFDLVSVDFEEGAENRRAFLKLLKEFPLGVSVQRHALVIAGYDEITDTFWIRDSAQLLPYYKKDADLVFSNLRNYYYFTRK